MHCFNSVVYKMNKILNTFLLAGDKFMPKMHLKQLGFTSTACGPFTKSKERIEKFMLEKVYFQHGMAHDKHKDLTKRTQSDKVLSAKAFEIASNPKYDGYQRGLVSMVFKFFDKKSTGNRINFILNQQLANKLHKPIIRKFKERRVYSSFKNKNWRADLADMQLISKVNKGIMYLLCAINSLVNILVLFL